MPLSSDIFGQIVSRRDVEQAVISHLQNWLPTYLAEIERQAGLPAQTIPIPPDPVQSYRGGLDFDGWQIGWEPVVISVVQALGEPERMSGAGHYTQLFEVQVGSVVQAEDEDAARALADYYGAAVMSALLQHGGLGTFQNGNPVALKTVLASYPQTQFPDPNVRRVIRSVVTVHSLVADVIVEAGGPSGPAVNPYQLPGHVPVVQTVHTNITAQKPS